LLGGVPAIKFSQATEKDTLKVKIQTTEDAEEHRGKLRKASCVCFCLAVTQCRASVTRLDFVFAFLRVLSG